MKIRSLLLGTLLAGTILAGPAFADLPVPSVKVVDAHKEQHVFYPTAWGAGNMQVRFEANNAETMNMRIAFAFTQGQEGDTNTTVGVAADQLLANTKAVFGGDVMAIVCTYGVSHPLCNASVSIHGVNLDQRQLIKAIPDASFLANAHNLPGQAPDMNRLNTLVHDAVVKLEQVVIKNGGQQAQLDEHQRTVTTHGGGISWYWYLLGGLLVVCCIWNFGFRRKSAPVKTSSPSRSAAPPVPPAPRPAASAPPIRPVAPVPPRPVASAPPVAPLPPAPEGATRLAAMRRRILALETGQTVNGRFYGSTLDQAHLLQLRSDYQSVLHNYYDDRTAYLREQAVLDAALDVAVGLATFGLIAAVYNADRGYYSRNYINSGYTPGIAYDAWSSQPGATVMVNDYGTAYVDNFDDSGVAFGGGDSGIPVDDGVPVGGNTAFGGGDSEPVVPAPAVQNDGAFGGGDSEPVVAAPVTEQDDKAFGGGDSEPVAAPAAERTDDTAFGGGDSEPEAAPEPEPEAAPEPEPEPEAASEPADNDFGGGDDSNN